MRIGRGADVDQVDGVIGEEIHDLLVKTNFFGVIERPIASAGVEISRGRGVIGRPHHVVDRHQATRQPIATRPSDRRDVGPSHESEPDHRDANR